MSYVKPIAAISALASLVCLGLVATKLANPSSRRNFKAWRLRRLRASQRRRKYDDAAELS